MSKVLLMGYADGFGGAQTAFRQLYDFVRSEGHAVKVIALTDQQQKDLPFGEKAIISCVTHQGAAPSSRTKKLVNIMQAGLKARRFQPDIFVSVGLSNSANTISRFLANSCFIIGQDFIADRMPHDALWQKSRAVLNGIVVQAPSMLRQWRSSQAQRAAVNWLPCFPEPPFEGVLRPTRAEKSGAGSPIKLAYFGRLASNKGLPLLLRALATKRVPPYVTLDLWGKGPEEEPLQKLAAELNLGERVRFMGKYPAAREGAELMTAYDALLLCSTECEGLPLILLESMAYGIPFLATDIGAICDCCIDNEDVLLVKPEQDSITKGLELLIQKIENNEFSPVRLKHFYDDKFSYPVMAERWRMCLHNPAEFFLEEK